MCTNDDLNDKKKKPNQSINICQVCGDNASIINYGALSCLSCRTFFRRNGLPHKEVPACRYDGDCEVNMLTRKVCQACRLAKCLAVGMKSDLIRKADLTREKQKSGKSKTEEIAVVAIPQQSALDRPPDGDLFLNASDWTLISNIVHAFDTFSPVSEVRRTIENSTTSASNIQYDISQSLNLMSSFYNSLQSFISSTPDFKVLTLDEQRSLFQRNMLGLLCVGGMYLMRESGIFDKPENESVMLPLYGIEVTQQARLICRQLNFDPVLIKVMLVALAFSSNCYMIHNRGNIDKDSLLLGTFRLLGSQNVYVELTWKYLLHTYGYNIAVQTFSKLIKQLLDTLALAIDMYTNNHDHQIFIDGIIRQNEIPWIIDEKATIPLWGKKL
ncbi:unnamed protein product [Rotaria sp. Silwood2]|nr:unnamed protein product [Rotaria sp. Silwood2]CAF3210568.1 unnamed protein product [Rotaria sp. Silwood2]CAF3338173.1 unnamed protein product [Rotaria sp. Silwood2]CAF4517600.1 unnamed protein product [Rotaria sp. Silwood2]CAF4627400.1 unnamed protein product [Rotaria sp. Silwood2]